MSGDRCIFILSTERGKMIATALQIQEATGDAVIDLSTLMLAKQLYDRKDMMSSEEFSNALFEYSAHLSALTATMVTHVLLSESDIQAMTDEIQEFDKIAKEVE